MLERLSEKFFINFKHLVKFWECFLMKFWMKNCVENSMVLDLVRKDFDSFPPLSPKKQ